MEIVNEIILIVYFYHLKELLKEIKDALNIDFDIDLEIKPDEKISKYSINSIKAYKANGSSD